MLEREDTSPEGREGGRGRVVISALACKFLSRAVKRDSRGDSEQGGRRAAGERAKLLGFAKPRVHAKSRHPSSFRHPLSFHRIHAPLELGRRTHAHRFTEES